MLGTAGQGTAVPAEERRLAHARERFVTAQAVGPYSVRDPILASWRRSRQLSVPAGQIELSYVRDPEPDTALARSALPVLHQLRDALDGQPISIVLADSTGLVLNRLAADPSLDRHLDGIRLAPGFSFAEQFAGTNGIGSALEGGGPFHVFGHEHYAERFAALACAGAPVRHPVSGRVVGLVDLTCWRKDANALMVALATTTASQIRQALLAAATALETQLLQEYLRACRRARGMVLGLGAGTVLLSEAASQVLDPADQPVLLGHAAQVLDSGRAGPVEVMLPTGMTVQLQCKPLRGSPGRAAGVVHVRVVDGASRAEPAPMVALRRQLPGLVGTGALWQRSCGQVMAGRSANEWLVLRGEPGTGKAAVLRAAHRQHDPAGSLRVIDAAREAGTDWLATVRSALAAESGSVVITHVDRLGPGRLPALAELLEEFVEAGRRDGIWVAVTIGPERPRAELVRMLRFFPRTVDLPPLRHHAEDLHDLVPFLLGRFGPPGRLVCSAEAMQVILRYSWPGNVGQLQQVLQRVVQHRRAGVITAEDLPPECRTVSRRLLTPLESMERDAVAQTLVDFDGSKEKAAHALGMSRATIYRKIREYGIVTPARPPVPG